MWPGLGLISTTSVKWKACWQLNIVNTAKHLLPNYFKWKVKTQEYHWREICLADLFLMKINIWGMQQVRFHSAWTAKIEEELMNIFFNTGDENSTQNPNRKLYLLGSIFVLLQRFCWKKNSQTILLINTTK